MASTHHSVVLYIAKFAAGLLDQTLTGTVLYPSSGHISQMLTWLKLYCAPALALINCPMHYANLADSMPLLAGCILVPDSASSHLAPVLPSIFSNAAQLRL